MLYERIITMDGVYQGYTPGEESTSFTKGHFSDCSFCCEGIKSIGMEKKSWGKADGVPIFYKQPARRDRNNEQGSEGTLEYRKHALAFGCDL